MFCGGGWCGVLLWTGLVQRNTTEKQNISRIQQVPTRLQVLAVSIHPHNNMVAASYADGAVRVFRYPCTNQEVKLPILYPVLWCRYRSSIYRLNCYRSVNFEMNYYWIFIWIGVLYYTSWSGHTGSPTEVFWWWAIPSRGRCKNTCNNAVPIVVSPIIVNLHKCPYIETFLALFYMYWWCRKQFL